jgi:hypothetical protein
VSGKKKTLFDKNGVAVAVSDGCHIFSLSGDKQSRIVGEEVYGLEKGQHIGTYFDDTLFDLGKVGIAFADWNIETIS